MTQTTLALGLKNPSPDKISPYAYAKECPVCGMPSGKECPHTPVRCEHKFWYGEISGPAGPWLNPSKTREGEIRICEECGFKCEAEITWKVIRAAYDN